MFEEMKSVRPKELRSFGLLVGGIFVFLGLLPTFLGGESPRLWLLILGGMFIGPGLVFPRSLALIYRVWMGMGHGLGWINTRILLGAVFYLLITPMGLVMRLIGKDAMCRKYDPGADTYRVVRQPRPSSHMLHQF